MSKPGRKRPPKGNGKRTSLADKDDRATSQQRADWGNLLVRMRARVKGPE